MIPKVDACVTAVAGGVKRAHIVDGRLPHALLIEIFTDQGLGTMITVTLQPLRQPPLPSRQDRDHARHVCTGRLTPAG